MVISQIQNSLEKHWNHDLNTMNPIIGTIFFTNKGVNATFGGASGNSSRPPRELKILLVSPMTYSNEKMQSANSNSKILYFWTPLVINLLLLLMLKNHLKQFCLSLSSLNHFQWLYTIFNNFGLDNCEPLSKIRWFD